MTGRPEGSELPLGAVLEGDGIRFSVWSSAAERIWVSLFDGDGSRETARHELVRGSDDVFSLFLSGLGAGVRYGLRADGVYDPWSGLWFDPSKLLMDPYALIVDRPYRYDARLGAARSLEIDTAALMPKAVTASLPVVARKKPRWRGAGLIYEVSVRAFTMLHPSVPPHQRGTVAALAHPAIIAHLKRIGVSAVELLPITASMDERHLPPLGMRNAWGYNPASFMALDPRLVPGGWVELRDTVAALHREGIGVVLDLVFNHTAESDAEGSTISLRGLDSRAYYRHAPDGSLVNDTGTGNTVACDHPAVRRLVLDSLRAFVRHAGVDGFRFDLAPVLGRDDHGFNPDAPLLRDMAQDPVLADRLLIAEPWDIGPGGYQLGSFRSPFLEWNDRYRDDVRRFWRGDGSAGALATRLAGSSDIFAGSEETTRSVNFLAAHDGMTLRDLVSYKSKHNWANGEDNRDGHDDNLSWNNGAEGETDDPAVAAMRLRDVKALLSTLFASRGAIMLTAGDEFGRSQFGNNNAYAQDNDTTWLDWSGAQAELLDHVAWLARFRSDHALLTRCDFLTNEDAGWLREDGEPMQAADWEDAKRRTLAMILRGDAEGLAVLINGSGVDVQFTLPDQVDGWRPAIDAYVDKVGRYCVGARSVGFVTGGRKSVRRA